MKKKNTDSQPVQSELAVQTQIQPVDENKVTVSLSKAEEKMITRLAPADRLKARADILAAKKAEKIAYLNSPETQARQARARETRSNFGVRASKDNLKVVITGMGSRFPVTLYKGQWEKLVENSEQIEAVVATLSDRE